MSAIGGPNIGPDTWDCPNPELVRRRLSLPVGYTKLDYTTAYTNLSLAISQDNKEKLRDAKDRFWIVVGGLGLSESLTGNEANECNKIKILADYALSNLKFQHRQMLARGQPSQSSPPAAAP